MTDRWEQFGVEWGWPYNEDIVWHARLIGGARTLCGRLVDRQDDRHEKHSFFPAAQIEKPQPCCAACKTEVDKLTAQEPL